MVFKGVMRYDFPTEKCSVRRGEHHYHAAIRWKPIGSMAWSTRFLRKRHPTRSAAARYGPRVHARCERIRTNVRVASASEPE